MSLIPKAFGSAGRGKRVLRDEWLGPLIWARLYVGDPSSGRAVEVKARGYEAVVRPRSDRHFRVVGNTVDLRGFPLTWGPFEETALASFVGFHFEADGPVVISFKLSIPVYVHPGDYVIIDRLVEGKMIPGVDLIAT